MKLRLFLTIASIFCIFIKYGKAQSKLGDNPSSINTASLFELESKKKGFLLPRMNGSQMNAINNPPEGLQVYNIDSTCVCIYRPTGWRSICAPDIGLSAWLQKGNDIGDYNSFLGTRNNASLRIRTDNKERMIIDSMGNIGVGRKKPTSTLDVNGSFSTTIADITDDYIVTNKDHIISGDASAKNIAISLPTAAGIKGRQYIIKKTDDSTNEISIKAQSGEKIDGDASLQISIPWQTKTIVSNGKNWLLIQY
jgi:hypothetical protein